MAKAKCKICKQPFEKKNQYHIVCSQPCVLEFIKQESERKWQRKKKLWKGELETHSSVLKATQDIFNKYIRLRDKDLPCISCGTTKDVEYAAGHFWATTYQYLRLNEDNVHKQCNAHCNMNLRGNLLEYRPNLIKKIGLERVEKLDNDRHLEFKKSIQELKEIQEYYKLKIKEL